MTGSPCFALADPTRRAILELLRSAQCSVNEVAAELEISQPTASKHLRILREAGFVAARPEAQRRLYRLRPGAFRDLDAWLASFRGLSSGPGG